MRLFSSVQISKRQIILLTSSLLLLSLLFLADWNRPVGAVLARHGPRIQYWWKIFAKDERLFQCTSKNTRLLDHDELRHAFGPWAEEHDAHSPDTDAFAPVLAHSRVAISGLVAPSTLGSGKLIGLPSETCFDRGGRWSSYRNQQLIRHDPDKFVNTAVLIRAWDDCGWSNDVVQNIRAIVAEVGGEQSQHQVFVLLHVRNDTLALEFQHRQSELLELLGVPNELHQITRIWTYAEMQQAYPDIGVYDVFYHSYMPVQQFMLRNPHFQSVWNWELDIRYTSHYGRFFSQVDEYARETTLTSLYDGQHFVLESEPLSSTSRQPGGREADLITLLPTFNASLTDWVWRNYLINYDRNDFREDLQACNILTTRLSRRLINAMDAENRRGSTMTAEMFAPSLAVEYGFKHIHLPHPIYLDRRWPSDTTKAVFRNNAKPHAGIMASLIDQEHYFEGSTWYFTNHFAQDLYSRWMGRAVNGPGSPEWEESHGHICLPPMLLHPVKGL